MIIAFPHKPQKQGGPGSFQLRFEKLLKEKGWEVTYAGSDTVPDVIMVVGGTKKMVWLYKHKKNGVPIICRLDGINWLHRKQSSTIQNWVLNEVRNGIFQVIRSKYTCHIVYQSRFVEQWWNKGGWKTDSKSSVINNGIDLNEFYPQHDNSPVSLLCVEGNLDYSPYAIELLNRLQKELIETSDFHSLILYGGFQDDENREKLDPVIDYRGKVSREKLPGVYKNAVYLSLDVNAACPNTVIEALASGVPVIGFDTGALKELVSDGSGEVVDYGSNPWELGFPDLKNLCEAALKVKGNWATYSKNARETALEKYDIQKVASKYLEIIEAEISRLQ